jgi:hypothetical protein
MEAEEFFMFDFGSLVVEIESPRFNLVETQFIVIGTHQ